MDERLRSELLRRERVDQAARTRCIELTRDLLAGHQPTAAAQEAMDSLQAIDEGNTSWLRRVVKEHGWPKRSQVGHRAANAAWLLAQHSDLDPAFQRECLELLSEAVQAGEASATDLAYLTDRVLRAEGKPQRYGTQFAPGPSGGFVPQPMENQERVDELRASVGLGPLEEYARKIQEMHGAP